MHAAGTMSTVRAGGEMVGSVAFIRLPLSRLPVCSVFLCRSHFLHFFFLLLSSELSLTSPHLPWRAVRKTRHSGLAGPSPALGKAGGPLHVPSSLHPHSSHPHEIASHPCKNLTLLPGAVIHSIDLALLLTLCPHSWCFCQSIKLFVLVLESHCWSESTLQILDHCEFCSCLFGACRPSEVDVLCIPTLVTWIISKNTRQLPFTAACSSPFCTYFADTQRILSILCRFSDKTCNLITAVHLRVLAYENVVCDHLTEVMCYDACSLVCNVA